MQAEPEPDSRGDQHTVEEGYCRESAGAVKGTDGDVGAPFPGEPGLPGTRREIGIETGKTTGGENGLAAADMPAGVGIAKQLLVALKEEQAIEQRHRGANERQIRR